MRAKEKAVRDAAAALQQAVVDARDDGYHVEWPRRFEDLAFIAVSEGGNSKTNVIVTAPAGADPALTAKAAAAAQKAVDKVTDPGT